MAEYDNEVFDYDNEVETDTTDESVETDTTGLEEPEDFDTPSDDESVETEEPTEAEDYSDVPEDVDNPKSYKHFQRLAQERFNENERLRQELETFKQSGSPVESPGQAVPEQRPEQTAPEEMTLPTEPVRPENYSEVDSLTDPSSVSYNYRKQMEEFKDTERKYMRQVIERQEQERIVAGNKSKILSSFQQSGLSLIESEKALQFFTSPDSVKPENMAKFYKWYTGQEKGSQLPPKKAKFDQPLPPGATPGITEDTRKTPDDAFNESLGKGKRDWGI